MVMVEENKIYEKFKPPFRLGKSKKRAILDSNGCEVVIFPEGLEYMAEDYVKYLNEKCNII